MEKIFSYDEFLNEKKSQYKKATLLKYKRKFEDGEEIPFGIANTLKALGMIPRADGETRVSDDYKTIGDKVIDAIKPEKKLKKEKKVNESLTISEIVFKMDKWLPDESELQEQYYDILDDEKMADDEKIKEIEEFLEMYADEDYLSQNLPANTTIHDLAKYIVTNQ